MKTIISTILLTLISSFTYGQCDKVRISKQDISYFINSFDKIDTTKTFYLSSSNQFDKIQEDLRAVFNDTSFSSSDLDFFRQQIKQHRHFKWNNKIAKGRQVISARKISRIFKDKKKWWKYFQEKYGSSYHCFSVPLFTCDKQTVVIYRSTHCGPLCGDGSIDVFVKLNGMWTFKKNYSFWIS